MPERHNSMGQHPLGIKDGNIMHMCPECGVNVKPFCLVCLGAGEVTNDRLARWEYQQHLENPV